jgi:uncharacterized protein YaiI (UPF0178 family)
MDSQLVTSRLFIDADACPVKNESIRIAERHKIETYIVSNGGIRPSLNSLVKTIVVSAGPDVADNWIVEQIQKSDIVITSDIPLASRCIEKGAFVLSHNGDPLNNDNIGLKLASRDLMTDIRSANPFHIGKGKPFSKIDRTKFLNQLEKIFQTIKKSL